MLGCGSLRKEGAFGNSAVSCAKLIAIVKRVIKSSNDRFFITSSRIGLRIRKRLWQARNHLECGQWQHVYQSDVANVNMDAQKTSARDYVAAVYTGNIEW